jgi:hypothetical protein
VLPARQRLCAAKRECHEPGPSPFLLIITNGVTEKTNLVEAKMNIAYRNTERRRVATLSGRRTDRAAKPSRLSARRMRCRETAECVHAVAYAEQTLRICGAAAPCKKRSWAAVR